MLCMYFVSGVNNNDDVIYVVECLFWIWCQGIDRVGNYNLIVSVL